MLHDIAQKQTKLSPELIKTIHKESFADILPKDAGQYRTVQVTYSSKEAPHYSKISELIHILCEDIEYALGHLPSDSDENYIGNVVEIVARFQHRFVFIHPFIDYNGRTARMFTNYILMRLKLPIIEVSVRSEKERFAYISSLQKADEGNYTSFEHIIEHALNESLKEV